MPVETHFHIEPGGALTGRIRVPGDKSISHRSVMLGAICEGTTRVSGFLEGADCVATIAAFRQMGVRIDGPTGGRVEIEGVGLHGLHPPQAPLDLGNSGTSMRLLSGLLAGQRFDSVLLGDKSLSKRPMGRVMEPLSSMGAHIVGTETGTPPVRITGGHQLQGIHYRLPMASAQVKSCLLLAGLYASGETCVEEPAPTRDHTERMLEALEYPVARSDGSVCVRGGGTLQARDIQVPSDISSAAFFLVGASIAPGSDLLLEQVGMNPTRTGVVDILRLMGADIEILELQHVAGEPIADIRVRAAPLRGIRVPEHLVPLAIDEFPAVFVAAACAEGETVVTGAEELRVKESDRIQVMADGLKCLGVDARPAPDGIVIRGGSVNGGEIDSHGDHRIAMAFAIAGLRASAPVRILDCGNVATSFPDFGRIAVESGLRLGKEL